jgi:membrane protease YdiL (CAAX protease family)
MSAPIESTAPKHAWRSLHRTAPVRLLVFFVALLAADVGGQLGLASAYHHAPAGAADWAALGAAIALAAVLLGIYAALARGLERRAPSELAPGAGRGVAGVIFGFLLFVVVLGLIRAAGAARLQGVSARFDAAPMLAVSILAAVGEELAFRGGVFRILEESCGTTVALVVSAAIFGLLHALNPGATVISTAAIAIEAGVLLGAAYALTRNLWLPIGLHFGWNFTEGGIFGVSVSGGAVGKGVLAVTLAGPRLLTGGKFGPEASVIAVAVCFSAAIVLIVLALKAGRWQPLRWRMA